MCLQEKKYERKKKKIIIFFLTPSKKRGLIKERENFKDNVFALCLLAKKREEEREMDNHIIVQKAV